MMQHDQLRRPWLVALVLGAAAFLLGRPALAQVSPPANLVPVAPFSITGNTSASETTDTRTADYTLTFTLAPDKVLDPPNAALLLRLETERDEPTPCGVIGIPENCFFPDAKGGYTLSDNCPVSVTAVKEALHYERDLTPLLERVSATLQQVKGAWQAHLVTTLREAVAHPIPCAITFTVGPHGVASRPSSSSDAKWRAPWR
jgi:hypothetical protein